MKRGYALAFASLCLASVFMTASVQAVEPADTLLTNATIYGHDTANTVAIDEGNIVFIGTAEAAQAYRHPHTEVINLKQAYLMPGFVDNHNHVFEAASEAGGSCGLSLDASLKQQIPYLKRCRQQATEKGWMMGYGFSLEALLSEESSDTPLEVIDRIFPKQPVIIMEQTSHAMWVNSAALKRAGITINTPDPQGGKILKDERSGELNGILFDNAGDILMEMAWNSLENQFEQSYQGLMTGLEEAAAHGITTIGDGRLYWKRGWYEVWQQAEKAGDLTARVSLRPWIYPADAMRPQLDFLQRIQSSDTSRLLLVEQAKMYSDGIIINGTAKTLKPYVDTYLPNDPYGINYIAPQQMTVWLEALHNIGYSAHIHAIGDGAVRESLNAIEQARKLGSNRPYTLTHIELVDDNDLPRFHALEVTADFQVGSDYVAEHDHQWAEPFLGAERTHALMNVRAMFDTQANISLSSDWNVHDINPLVGIANSLIMGETGLPDVHAAIEAYTINAAKSLGLSDITGSIDVGKSADFVILSQDITQLPADQIADTEILMTLLKGEVVFDGTH